MSKLSRREVDQALVEDTTPEHVLDEIAEEADWQQWVDGLFPPERPEVHDEWCPECGATSYVTCTCPMHDPWGEDAYYDSADFYY